ncbi:hypothetical protein ABK040_010893 [Willaertia magna]
MPVYEPTSPIYYHPYSPAYTPVSPSYPPISLDELESNGITFQLPSSILQFLNEKIKKTGLLRQRSVKYAEYHWGHVYLQIDSKIKQILLDDSYLGDLLTSLKEEYSKFELETKITDFKVPTIVKIEKTESTLPSHISVIPSYEFQSKFFTGDVFIDYPPLICDIRRGNKNSLETSSDVSKELEKSNDLKLGVEERKKCQEEKVNDFLMFKYVKKNYKLFTNLPEEIINLIESFIVLNIETCDLEHYFPFEFTGQVTFHPNYNKSYAFCVFLHVRSQELENIRKKYGFNSPFEFHYTIGVVDRYCYYSEPLASIERSIPYNNKYHPQVRSDVDDLEKNPKRLKRVWTDN